jgi:hypothetical protein
MIKQKNNNNNLDNLIIKAKYNCLHSEPNYGVLWFYYKRSMIDNAIDVWKNAEK